MTNDLQTGLDSFESAGDTTDSAPGTAHRESGSESDAGTQTNNATTITASDGHVENPDGLSYWHDEQDGIHAPSRRDITSWLPYGRVFIVLVDDSDHVEFAYGREDSVSAGIYLSDKEEKEWLSRPASPVALSDNLLQFAAEWSLLVTRDIVSNPGNVVAITKEEWGSLNIALVGQSEPQRVKVGALSGTGTGELDEYRGFNLIRTFDTPYELYTQCQTHRLALDDLRKEALDGFMPRC